MTNTTEDLAVLLAKHSIAGMCGGFSDQPEAKTHACRCDCRWVTATEYIEHVAEVIAAHFQRTVTTAEELDALPVGSVILDIGGEPWQKDGPVFLGQLGGSLKSAQLVVALPARVLHVGG